MGTSLGGGERGQRALGAELLQARGDGAERRRAIRADQLQGRCSAAVGAEAGSGPPGPSGGARSWIGEFLLGLVPAI